MSAPIAYADRLASRTLCPSCAFTRIAMDDSEESGPIMRHDLDPDDTCPCDVCGTLCSPDNITGTTYIIGSNMPGYMPDSEPFTIVGTFDDAKRALIDELKFLEDHADAEEEAEEFCEAAEDVNLWSRSDTIRVGNYVYWIATD